MEVVKGNYCQRCNSAVSSIRSYKGKRVCDLCYTTNAGAVFEYRHLEEHKVVIQAIVQIGNVVLERLKHGSDFEWDFDSDDAQFAGEKK